MDSREPSHHEVVAIRKSKIEGWEPFKWERAGDDTIITGGVPRLLKSGPRAGKRTWRDSKESMVDVTKAEAKAQEVEYERTTGNCGCCYGKGEVFQSWNHLTGTKYIPCKACDGTGKKASA